MFTKTTPPYEIGDMGKKRVLIARSEQKAICSRCSSREFVGAASAAENVGEMI